MKVWTGCIWLTISTIAGLCEHGSGTSGSVEGGPFIEQLREF